MTKQNIKFIETKVAAIKLQGFNPKLDNKLKYKTTKTTNMAKSIDWGKLLKVIIAVLTAIAGSIGVVSCIS